MQRMGTRTKKLMPNTTEGMHSRVKVLEVGVHKLETRMDAGFIEIGKQIRLLTDKFTESPKQIPFREIAATIAVCLGIFAYAGQYLEGQYKKNISVLEYRVEQLERLARSK